MITRHIKRDGAWLCKKNIGKHKSWHKNGRSISFKEAHTADLDKEFTEKIPPYRSFKGEKTKTHRYFCGDCVKRYFEIIKNMPNPIIIDQ